MSLRGALDHQFVCPSLRWRLAQEIRREGVDAAEDTVHTLLDRIVIHSIQRPNPPSTTTSSSAYRDGLLPQGERVALLVYMNWAGLDLGAGVCKDAVVRGVCSVLQHTKSVLAATPHPSLLSSASPTSLLLKSEEETTHKTHSTCDVADGSDHHADRPSPLSSSSSSSIGLAAAATHEEVWALSLSRNGLTDAAAEALVLLLNNKKGQRWGVCGDNNSNTNSVSAGANLILDVLEGNAFTSGVVMRLHEAMRCLRVEKLAAPPYPHLLGAAAPRHPSSKPQLPLLFSSSSSSASSSSSILDSMNVQRADGSGGEDDATTSREEQGSYISTAERIAHAILASPASSPLVIASPSIASDLQDRCRKLFSSSAPHNNNKDNNSNSNRNSVGAKDHVREVTRAIDETAPRRPIPHVQKEGVSDGTARTRSTSRAIAPPSPSPPRPTSGERRALSGREGSSSVDAAAAALQQILAEAATQTSGASAPAVLSSNRNDRPPNHSDPPTPPPHVSPTGVARDDSQVSDDGTLFLSPHHYDGGEGTAAVFGSGRGNEEKKGESTLISPGKGGGEGYAIRGVEDEDEEDDNLPHRCLIPWDKPGSMSLARHQPQHHEEKDNNNNNNNKTECSTGGAAACLPPAIAQHWGKCAGVREWTAAETNKMGDVAASSLSLPRTVWDILCTLTMRGLCGSSTPLLDRPAPRLASGCITVLDLSHNGIAAVPACTLPPTLLRLDLSHNALQDFGSAEWIRPCRMLAVLNLRHNQLGRRSRRAHTRGGGGVAPPCDDGDVLFSHTPHLTHLFLGHNRLKSLEAIIGGPSRLVLLHTLDVSHNSITRVEGLRVLSLCHSLQHLIVRGNPLATHFAVPAAATTTQVRGAGAHAVNTLHSNNNNNNHHHRLLPPGLRPAIRNLCPQLMFLDDVKLAPSASSSFSTTTATTLPTSRLSSTSASSMSREREEPVYSYTAKAMSPSRRDLTMQSHADPNVRESGPTSASLLPASRAPVARPPHAAILGGYSQPEHVRLQQRNAAARCEKQNQEERRRALMLSLSELANPRRSEEKGGAPPPPLGGGGSSSSAPSRRSEDVRQRRGPSAASSADLLAAQRRREAAQFEEELEERIKDCDEAPQSKVGTASTAAGGEGRGFSGLSGHPRREKGKHSASPPPSDASAEDWIAWRRGILADILSSPSSSSPPGRTTADSSKMCNAGDEAVQTSKVKMRMWGQAKEEEEAEAPRGRHGGVDVGSGRTKKSLPSHPIAAAFASSSTPLLPASSNRASRSRSSNTIIAPTTTTEGGGSLSLGKKKAPLLTSAKKEVDKAKRAKQASPQHQQHQQEEEGDIVAQRVAAPPPPPSIDESRVRHWVSSMEAEAASMQEVLQLLMSLIEDQQRDCSETGRPPRHPSSSSFLTAASPSSPGGLGERYHAILEERRDFLHVLQQQADRQAVKEKGEEEEEVMFPAPTKLPKDMVQFLQFCKEMKESQERQQEQGVGQYSIPTNHTVSARVNRKPRGAAAGEGEGLQLVASLVNPSQMGVYEAWQSALLRALYLCEDVKTCLRCLVQLLQVSTNIEVDGGPVAEEQEGGGGGLKRVEDIEAELQQRVKALRELLPRDPTL